ncbi:MarR family winged helix-turn-helix transcriptional regulator [Thiomonas sp. FB-Cd]|uniref:MarR family winged helix-turn-helix transcriptional regulator n=1 Tax=Thiomonas sp. FB-Cd TaxID=1158292 RepID=UPI00068DB579|nr:MarR family transcriptional regulator [Thiomonas sp. FB-Cd]
MMDIARNFGFLFSEVSRRYVQRFERKAQKMSLTLPTCKVLAYLERNAGISQARLAELTNIEPMTVVRILDRMEAEGLVERRQDPIDRRAHCLCLTSQAKPALDEIWRLADQTRAEIFAGVSQAERTAFLHVLARLAHNLRVLEEPSIDGDPGVAQPSPGRKSLASTRCTRIPVDRTR